MSAASIALQLSTVREDLERDFAGTLERVAALGYDGVETAFFPDHVPLGQVRETLDRLGLTVCAAHTDLPIGENRAPVLTRARTLGCGRIVWHGWPEDARYGSAEGITSLIADYNAAAAVAYDAGLILGLHNHWWEFRTIDGARPFDRLVTEVDPVVFFEIDVYWAQVAGVDPATLLRSLGPRAALLHVKDGPAIADAPKTTVGSGALPIPGILAASRADWHIVELDDCDGPMLDAVAQSLDYLRRLPESDATT
jgi:sugar phosphate isomerase/epimerase